MFFTIAVATPNASAAGAYQLAYWRESGANENAGNHSAHVHVWDQNGQPLTGRQIYTSWGVLLGTTDANGYVEVVLNRPNGYDFQVRSGADYSDTTPVLSVERAPDYGHYSFEVAFMYRPDGQAPPVFDSRYSGTINSSGTERCSLSAPHTLSLAFYSTWASNFCSDTYALGTWGGSHGQTFVATGNRVLAVKAQMAAGGAEHYTWTAQIHEGGPSGPAVGPSRTTRTVVDSEYYQVVLKWGLNDVQVVPGRTYYLRITRPTGVNAYTVTRNNYPAGTYYRDDQPISGQELMGLVLCGTVTNSGPVGTVAGFVRTANDLPLAGSLVTVSGVTLYALSAGDGSFSIPGIPEGTYAVVATKPAYLARQENATVADGETTVLNFQLTPQPTNNGAISGVIRDTQDQPLGGVRVTAYPGGTFVESDPGGNYLISLGFGSYRVVASKPGFNSEVVSDITVTNGQVTTQPFTLGPQLLANGGFEAGFAGNLANGWTAFRMPGASGAAYVEEASTKLGGARAQRWWTSYATHDVGIYQRVPAVSDGQYTFHAWTWRSDQWNNGSANQESWVGIDPYGETDPASPNVIWSTSQYSYQTWTRQTAAVTARSGQITLYVRGRGNWAGSAMQTAVDDTVLLGPAAYPPGLRAKPGNLQVELTWYPIDPDDLYNVKRSTSPNGPFEAVAVDFVEPTFTDRSVANGVTYYYVVSLLTHFVEGPDSPVVSATPTADYLLVPAGSTWRFLDNGSNQGNAWRGLGFDDPAWRSGSARLGYGGDGEVTVVSYGSDAARKHVTTYFRRAFVLPEAGRFTNLVVRLVRDDGGIVYLNGTEVFRSNMTNASVSYNTLALASVSGNAEFSSYSTNVSPALLRSGTNLVAVEIHQSGIDSSDLGFDLELVGQYDPTIRPHLTLEHQGALFSITWPTHAEGYVLESAPGLEPSAQWTPVSGTLSQLEHQLRVTVPVAGDRRFFRLRKQ